MTAALEGREEFGEHNRMILLSLFVFIFIRYYDYYV